MDSQPPPGTTMAQAETGERGMSLDQQPAHTGQDTPPPRRRASGRTKTIALASAAVIAIAAALTGVAMGLGGDDPAAPSETPVAAQPAAPAAPKEPVAPVVAPPVKTPNDLAAEAAQARYREYLRVDDLVGKGGYQSSAPYDAVAVVPERGYVEVKVRQSKALGARVVGDKSLASLAVTSVDLTPAPGGYPKVVLQACVDVTNVDVVDATGKSLVTADRVERSKSTVTMYQYKPGTKGAKRGGWLVFEATSLGEPC